MEPLIFNPPHEVILPDSINWWPPSLPLIGLILAVSALCVWLVIVIRHYRRAFAAQRQAVTELQLLLAQHEDNSNDTSTQLTTINQILKRVALHYYPQEKSSITVLHGQEWSVWLCSKIRSKVRNKIALKPENDYAASLLLLNQSIYQSATQLPNVITVPAAIDIVQTWCKKGLPRFNLVTMKLTSPRSVLPTGAVEHG
jgi:hypothetical protein